MTATAEQADLAQRIILECLDKHDQHREPFQQVWTEPAHDFDDVPVLDVWVTYDGEPRSLDTALHNTFHTYLGGTTQRRRLRHSVNLLHHNPHCIEQPRLYPALRRSAKISPTGNGCRPCIKPRSPGAQGTSTSSVATPSGLSYLGRLPPSSWVRAPLGSPPPLTLNPTHRSEGPHSERGRWQSHENTQTIGPELLERRIGLHQ